MNDEVF
jgi:hypothetical protein